MGDLLFLIIGLVVVAALVVGGLLVGGRRRRIGTPTAGTDIIAPPREEATAPAEGATVVEEAAPAAPTLERPEGTASRLVRLRQRLAGSQGGLGRGLLKLLSRERLDEDTWEEIEDTLITADVGVAPTQELVERLRTRLRVEGAGEASASTILREELLALVDPSMDRRIAV